MNQPLKRRHHRLPLSTPRCDATGVTATRAGGGSRAGSRRSASRSLRSGSRSRASESPEYTRSIKA